GGGRQWADRLDDAAGQALPGERLDARGPHAGGPAGAVLRARRGDGARPRRRPHLASLPHADDRRAAPRLTSTRMATTSDPALEGVAWDLRPLLNGGGEDPGAAFDSMLAEAQERADVFAEQHAGKVSELDGPGLVEAMRELGEIQDLATRAGGYAHLRFSLDTG